MYMYIYILFDFDTAAWSPGLATKVETGVISSPGHRRTKVVLSERAEHHLPCTEAPEDKASEGRADGYDRTIRR